MQGMFVAVFRFCLHLFKRQNWYEINLGFFLITPHCSPEEPTSLLDVKTKAVEEMMERIKKGIILKPMKRIQVQGEKSV